MKTLLNVLGLVVVGIILSNCQKEEVISPISNESDSPNGYLFKSEPFGDPVNLGDLATIIFFGSEQIDGHTKFTYQVASGTKPSLSHWNLLVKPSETDEGVQEVVVLECSEVFEQGNDGSLKKYDGELADLNWLKFDDGYNDGESRTVSFTLEGIWFEGDVYGIAKGGKDFAKSVITGPVQVKCFECGELLIDDRLGGKTYKTVKIGEDCWMAENLKWLPEVYPSTNMSLNEPRYYVYGHNSSSSEGALNSDNYNKYGVLYNFPAAIISCPDGWHLPSDNEWMILEGEIDSKYGVGNPIWDRFGWAGEDVGLKMMTNNEEHWYPPHVKATNNSGFSSMGSGYVWQRGFHGLMQNEYFYSSTISDKGNPWRRTTHNNHENIARADNANASWGASVRCIKDN